MNPILNLRRSADLTQTELARRAGTSQSAIAAYESGAKSPTLRTVERLASAAGLELSVRFVPPMTREDRRSLWLHDRIADHLRADPESVLQAAHTNLDFMWQRHPGARALLAEWRVILDRPVDEIARTMTNPDLHGRDLRQITPFAGVISAAERAAIYRSFREQEAAA